MGWESLWPLIFGFLISGAIQAVVSHEQMSRLLPDARPRTLVKAAGLGIASSSCSYAATALTRSLLPNGKDQEGEGKGCRTASQCQSPAGRQQGAACCGAPGCTGSAPLGRGPGRGPPSFHLARGKRSRFVTPIHILPCRPSSSLLFTSLRSMPPPPSDIHHRPL